MPSILLVDVWDEVDNRSVKQSLPFGLKTQFQREGKFLRKNSYKGVDDELTNSWALGAMGGQSRARIDHKISFNP